MVLWLILLCSLQSCYNATEAHKHTHETVNACSDRQVYDERGRRR